MLPIKAVKNDLQGSHSFNSSLILLSSIHHTIISNWSLVPIHQITYTEGYKYIYIYRNKKQHTENTWNVHPFKFFNHSHLLSCALQFPWFSNGSIHVRAHLLKHAHDALVRQRVFHEIVPYQININATEISYRLAVSAFFFSFLLLLIIFLFAFSFFFFCFFFFYFFFDIHYVYPSWGKLPLVLQRITDLQSRGRGGRGGRGERGVKWGESYEIRQLFAELIATMLISIAWHVRELQISL